MKRSTRWLALALASTGCTAHPATPTPTSAPAGFPSSSASAVPLSACQSPWSLGVVGGGGQVVLMCPGDVRREALDPSGPLAPALVPALDPARERVCGCAARLRPPPFVDLVFTANLPEGRVRAEAKGDADEFDSELGAPFVACVGTVVASFPPMHATGCGGAAATVVYPVRLELEP